MIHCMNLAVRTVGLTTLRDALESSAVRAYAAYGRTRVPVRRRRTDDTSRSRSGAARARAAPPGGRRRRLRGRRDGGRRSHRVLAVRAAARSAAEVPHDSIPAERPHCPASDCVEGALSGRARGSAKPRRIRAVPGSANDGAALSGRSSGSCAAKAGQETVGTVPSWLFHRHAKLVRPSCAFTRFGCGTAPDVRPVCHAMCQSGVCGRRYPSG